MELFPKHDFNYSSIKIWFHCIDWQYLTFLLLKWFNTDSYESIYIFSCIFLNSWAQRVAWRIQIRITWNRTYELELSVGTMKSPLISVIENFRSFGFLFYRYWLICSVTKWFWEVRKVNRLDSMHSEKKKYV